MQRGEERKANSWSKFIHLSQDEHFCFFPHSPTPFGNNITTELFTILSAQKVQSPSLNYMKFVDRWGFCGLEVAKCSEGICTYPSARLTFLRSDLCNLSTKRVQKCLHILWSESAQMLIHFAQMWVWNRYEKDMKHKNKFIFLKFVNWVRNSYERVKKNYTMDRKC